MEHARFPIDICEVIIDKCHDPVPGPWIRVNYPTWLACALVCAAWVPRSRHNLLLEVSLLDESSVDCLIRTLTERPRLADIVIKVAIHSSVDKYIPLTRLPLPRLLQKCRALDLTTLNWAYYPARFRDCLAQFSQIDELTLSIHGLSISTILYIIWSFPRLRLLRLSGNPKYIHFQASVSNKLAVSCVRKAHSPSRQQLVLLRLSMSTLIETENFPPPFALGQSIVDLRLDMTSGQAVSGSMQAAMREFKQLRTLHLLVIVVDHRARIGTHQFTSIFSVLPCVQSGLDFRHLFVHMSPDDSTNSYHAARLAFLDFLCGDDMARALESLPGLDTFRLQLDDNDPACDARWWTEKIVQRLPRLRSVIAVQINLKPLELYKSLWNAEVATAAETQKTPYTAEQTPRSSSATIGTTVIS